MFLIQFQIPGINPLAGIRIFIRFIVLGNSPDPERIGSGRRHIGIEIKTGSCDSIFPVNHPVSQAEIHIIRCVVHFIPAGYAQFGAAEPGAVPPHVFRIGKRSLCRSGFYRNLKAILILPADPYQRSSLDVHTGRRITAPELIIVKSLQDNLNRISLSYLRLIHLISPLGRPDVIAVIAWNCHLSILIVCIAPVQVWKCFPILQIYIQGNPDAVYIGSRISGKCAEHSGRKNSGC